MTDSAKLPLDYQLEREQLQQKQALANAIMQRSLTPNAGQMVGPNYANPGAGATFAAPVIQALMAKHMMGKNSEQAATLAERFKGIENRMSPKEILSVPGASLASRRQAALANAGQGDLSLLTPDQREHIVNGQVVTTTPGEAPAKVGDFRDQYGQVKTVGTNPDGTPIQAQVIEGTGENKYTPSGGVKVNVDTQQKAGDAFGVGLAQKRAEVITKSYDNAQAANKALHAITEAKQDLANGINSGSAAHISLGLAKVGTALGMKADPATVNTEAFRSNMARETLNLVKNLGAGTGISNADRDFAEKAAGGDIMLDSGSMLRLANIAIAASGNVLHEHQRLLETNSNATGALPADLETFRVPYTIPGGKQQPGDVTFDEKLGRFGTIPAGSGGVGVPAGGPRKPTKSNW